MRSREKTINLVFCALICALGLGCTAAEDLTIPVVAPTVELPSQAESPEDSSSLKEPEQRADQTTETGRGAKPGNTASLAYEPPFPDRVDPFLAPQRDTIANSNGVGDSSDEIQLLGFANVRGQKAILSINGMVVPIGEGGLESGVEVISIHPPAVVLQRNNQRWQTSLEY